MIASRHGAVKPERITDGINILPHLQIAGSRKHSRCQVSRRNLQQRHVVRLVLQNDLRLVLMFIAQRHFDLLRIFNHVIVGEDPSVLRKDEA